MGGLMGTKAISIPMFTVLRRFSMPIMLCSEIFILKRPQSKGVILSIVICMVGTVVAAMNDLAFNMKAYLIIGFSTIMTSAYSTAVTTKLTGANKRTKWEVLFCNSLVSIPLLLFVLWYKGLLLTCIHFPQWTNPSFLACFVLSSSLGLVLNFGVLYNNQVNGPLSTTVLGCAKNVLTTYLGMWGVGGDYIFTWANFWGVNISMVGAIIYSFEKKKAKPG